jgi:hypothetical protein
MKLLLVHPEDSPVEGPWTLSRWDVVIDLGWAGENAYGEWAERMGCPVRGFWSYGHGPQDFQRIGEILQPGLGMLLDGQGLDWWEILAPLRIHEVLQLLLVEHVLREIGAVELVGTHPHPLANLFGRVAGREVRYLDTRKPSVARLRWQRLTMALWRLSAAQVVQVVLDKWDMDYRLRSRVARRRRPGPDGAVLLPSGYENVTQILNSYAGMLPERRFLLLTTRKSGEMRKRAANVDTARLSGYARSGISDATRKELRSLEDSWRHFRRRILPEEIARANGAQWFEDIGSSFESWLRIRDAWRQVLESERIQAVLCGDENSPTNRIPVLLARKHNLPTVHCHHGALNALLPLRPPGCGRYLVKGEMELDFMTRTFRLDGGQIEVGAPAATVAAKRTAGAGAIVFFSEEYELAQGRSRVLYREVLPRLCALARTYGKRVIVKLHPFESAASRKNLVREVLSAAERAQVDMVHGPLTPELLENTWVAVTVESSVSVDCAIRGIPCFVCSWFVTPVAGYVEQFVKYGAARALDSPQDIARIPERLQDFEIEPEVRRRLWDPIDARKLEALLQDS